MEETEEGRQKNRRLAAVLVVAASGSGMCGEKGVTGRRAEIGGCSVGALSTVSAGGRAVSPDERREDERTRQDDKVRRQRMYPPQELRIVWYIWYIIRSGGSSNES
ncbi:predicted protein [Histoplasma capsulatum G186AR]|uniref:Uncharacterized protein n=1 Tax=Ajellomyces capsulatus (strain G186AR / H82 / ATCC MYA-2454 / RMSCC 2432) TaxID=447093 RepID=C0NLF2_AJECG|nr:uncharacterized protein HCBG_04332 [Histoplasma capsulatum G186AR]EEH07453.1 predicted protein [Histoplasma capsulatum G186AR]